MSRQPLMKQKLRKYLEKKLPLSQSLKIWDFWRDFAASRFVRREQTAKDSGWGRREAKASGNLWGKRESEALIVIKIRSGTFKRVEYLNGSVLDMKMKKLKRLRIGSGLMVGQDLLLTNAKKYIKHKTRSLCLKVSFLINTADFENQRGNPKREE